MYAALCRGAVFATFSGALVCFWAPPHLLRAVLASPAVAVLALLALTAAAATVLAAGSGLRRLADDRIVRLLPSPQGPWWAHLALGARAYAVLLLVAVQQTSIPTFVYVPF